MRVHELAKELNIGSKELLERLKQLNFPAKSHMSVIDDETAEIIKHEISDLEKQEIAENVIEVEFPITLKDLAVKLNLKPSELLKEFMKEGKLFTINQSLSEEVATEFAYKRKITLKQKATFEEKVFDDEGGEEKQRAPVVTLMGHIDHGKTSILDYIRKSRITARESGGITQHIGAYSVDYNGKMISFVDTPGHATFTAMRARGANVTDIVIIVIAADEGIKPQTVEAIDHAKAANAPIIVAINKIDRKNADVDMVKQQLSKHELSPEDWGGKTICCPVSAQTGEGIEHLLEMIILQAEIMELKAVYERSSIGVVVEAKLSKGRGSVATVLVQQGILKVSDICVCGSTWGKIKALNDDKRQRVDSAIPSQPVEIIGLNGVPTPGDTFFIAPDEKTARNIVERRLEQEKKEKEVKPVHFKLEDLHKKIAQEHLKQLKIILKADVGGTLEAVEVALSKFSTEEVELQFVHKGVGAINHSDVLLADVSDAVIVGFKVDADTQARDMAKQKDIEIRIYHIVYELIDDIKAALEGMLAPTVRRTFLGRAKVNKVFKLSKSGIIAGCTVEKGKIIRDTAAQLTRDNEVIFDGKVVSLKRFKDDAKEVTEGLECGISVGYDKIKEGDIIDVFNEEIITRRI